MDLQQRIFDLIELGVEPGRRLGTINIALLILIAINVAAFVLETVPELGQRYARWFDLVLYVSVTVFSIEYLLRVWVATRHPSGLYAKPVRGRLRYLLSPLALLDLFAILPFYLGTFFGLDLRFLRLLRLLWMLKVTRYLPAMASLGRVLKRERRTLAAVFVIMGIMLFIASALIYLLEREAQPEAFASIPHAMWWGMATLTTVGYGDVVPVSPMGRVLGMLIMMLGIGTFALPAGILASAFAEEKKRQDFLLTWHLVAKVPAFAFLSAREISEIAALLHPREAMVNEVIFCRGDDAGSMFFIVSGAVEVETPSGPIRLKTGDFFGEIALIFHRERTASVVALSHVELLELEACDLFRLFEGKPKLRSRITAEATRRLAESEPEQRDHVEGDISRGDSPGP